MPSYALTMGRPWGPIASDPDFVPLPDAYKRLRVGTSRMNIWLLARRLEPVVDATGGLGVTNLSLEVFERHPANAGTLRKVSFAVGTLLRQAVSG